MVDYWSKSTTAQLMIIILSSLAIAFFPLVSCAIMNDQEGVIVESGNNEESKSTDQKVCHFDRLSIEILGCIGSYLTNPVVSIGFLNKKFYHIFHYYFPVGYYVSQRFNIDEFKTVSISEIELNSLLNSSWCRNEPFMLFKSLLKDFISMKQNYQALVSPYYSYLMSAYSRLSANERSEIDQYFNNIFKDSFDNVLGRVSVNYGNFDVAFALLAENRLNLFKYFLNFKDKKSLFEFFKLNPQKAQYFMNQILEKISDGFDIYGSIIGGHWIANCIIYDAPPEYFMPLLEYKPDLWNNSFQPLFFSHKVSESEYSRIYTLVNNVIDFISTKRIMTNIRDYFFFHSLNKVRFGHGNLSFGVFKQYNDDGLDSIVRVALLGNKREVFYESYGLLKERLHKLDIHIRDDQIFRRFIETLNADMNYFQSKNFSMIYEIIASEANNLFSSKEHLNNRFLLNFLMSAYAAKNLHKEGDTITFVFIAFGNLIDLGFPPLIRFDISDYDLACDYVDYIFSYMKVFTAETLFSIFNDYINNFMVPKTFSASFEMVELISNSPLLIEKLTSSGIKLKVHFGFEKIEKFFDLPNFDNMSQIVEVLCLASKFKYEEQFRKFEILKSKTFAEIFLKMESEKFLVNVELTEFDYFDWRQALAYWIKGDQRERIKEIRSPAIIKMLKIEFPKVMSELLGNEVKQNSEDIGTEVDPNSEENNL